MTFTVNSIPQCITGTDPRPTFYGQSARQWQDDLLKQAKDEFQRSGDNAPLDKVAQATIRYTPNGTLSKGYSTSEAFNNAIGYAKKDIELTDKDGDGAISKEELADIYKQPFIEGMTRLKNQYKAFEQMPGVDQATKDRVFASVQQQYDGLEKMAAKEQITAANFFAAVDCKDANGQSDGKLTADELAAKTLFDDSASDMFKDNQQSYKIVLDGLKAKSDMLKAQDAEYTGPDFETLKQSVNEIEQRPRAEHEPLAMDGQITADERELADKLVEAPIPTNQIISNIHKALNLKDKVNAASPTTGPSAGTP